MIQPQGFVDLRALPSAPVTDDSVWPSFTDIMTVVVIIFLMALVVILMRNVDLVRQLRQTVELEQETAIQSDTMSLRIAALGDEIASLQLKLGEADAVRSQAESTVSENQEEISRLLDNIAALESVKGALEQKTVDLEFAQEGLEESLLSAEKKEEALDLLVDELKTDVAILSLKRDTLIEEKDGLVLDNIALRQDLKASRNISTQLAAGLKASEEEADKYRAEGVVLLEKNTTLLEKLDELVSIKEILENRIEALDKEATMLDEEKASLVERSESLDKRVAALTRYQEILEADVIALSDDVKELRETKAGLEADNQSKTAYLARLQALQESLEEEKVDLAKKLGRAEADGFALKSKLEKRIDALERSRENLEDDKTTLEDQASQLERQLASQQSILMDEILDLEKVRDRLKIDNQDLVLRIAFLEGEVDELSRDLTQRERQVAALEKQREDLTREQVAALEKQREDLTREQEATLSKLEAQNLALTKQLGPKRSMLGKHVVGVRIWIQDEIYRFSLADPRDAEPLELSEEELYAHLDALLEQYGDSLYTKNMPDDRMSHGEANKIVTFIRCKYDYYDPPNNCEKP